jgi:hypothetical protein
VKIPEGLSFEEAGATPLVSLTAWQVWQGSPMPVLALYRISYMNCSVHVKLLP